MVARGNNDVILLQTKSIPRLDYIRALQQFGLLAGHTFCARCEKEEMVLSARVTDTLGAAVVATTGEPSEPERCSNGRI